MLRAWLAAIALCVMATAVQAQRTYEGREAAALRCASMFAVTAVVLAETDQFSEVERDVLLFASVAILERHVSGTWRQKRRALDLLKCPVAARVLFRALIVRRQRTLSDPCPKKPELLC